MDKLVKYLCIIQARMNSSRLPAKVMLDLGGKTLLERVYETVSRSKIINQIVVATSRKISDDVIELKLNNLKIEVYRGSLNNVLERFYDVSSKYNAQNIIRITADNPLMDARMIDKLIFKFESGHYDYAMFSNAIYGLSAEVFSYSALEKAYKNSRNDFDREHVTPYIKDNLTCLIEDIEAKYQNASISVTVDTLDDYLRMQKFYCWCKTSYKTPTIDNFLLREEFISYE